MRKLRQNGHRIKLFGLAMDISRPQKVEVPLVPVICVAVAENSQPRPPFGETQKRRDVKIRRAGKSRHQAAVRPLPGR
jgi:hypothetical protein